MSANFLPAFDAVHRTLFSALLGMLLAGCVTLVAPFDKDGLARITELSKSSLAVYQSLLDTKPHARGADFTGKLAKNWADIETQARVHIVFEHSREKNGGSIDAANQLLGFWEDAQKKYCRAAKPDPVTPGAFAPANSSPVAGASVPGTAASVPTASGSNTCSGLGKADKEAMIDFVLKRDRVTLERILGSMVKAEEAKKLASGATN